MFRIRGIITILAVMLAKILNIGIDDKLGLEARAQVKLQNFIVLFSFVLIIFFSFYHLFYTARVDIGTIFFGISCLIPLFYWFQHTKKYFVAKIFLFLFLYAIIFLSSMVLMVGHGNEYYYISLSILILILNKNTYWNIFFIILNMFLFLLPHFYYPTIQEEFFVSTHVAVFISSLLVVTFFINIQNKFRARLKDQKVILELLNEEKNDLMGVVAHDLKSPLAQIQGLIEILKLENGNLTKEQLGLVEKIKRVANNQHSQISSYLDVKALEDSIQNLEMEQVPISEIIKKVLNEMRPQAEAKSIEIKSDCDGSDMIVMGSVEGFFKVVSNLISNAIKYSYANTIVNLKVERINGSMLLIVKDQGQGFSKEDLKFVFTKNQKLSAKPTANESASGMGLYIVKKYVDKMNGEVRLESTKGEGATFFVKLPLLH